MANLEINGVIIKKALVIDGNGDPIVNFPINLPDLPPLTEGEEPPVSPNPILSAERVAGYVNMLMKQHYNRAQIVPSGAVLVLYDESNRVIGKFRWIVDPKKKNGARSVKVITNKIFPKEK